VLGPTGWGTTLASILARNGHDVRLLCAGADEAAAINATRRASRAPDLELAQSITATHDLHKALDGAGALIIAVPSQTMRDNARRVRDTVPPHTLTVHATKGLEQTTCKRMSDVLLEEIPQLASNDVCVLSGPNLAAEIQRGLPAATVIAGADGASVRAAQALFHTTSFRVYTSSDVVGVELSGALKNVVAICAGIADGLRVGDNAKAGIITRGIAEVARLGVAAGADPMTFLGLAGIGDVMATCYSPLSRNRRFGEALGRGESVAGAIGASAGVVEGVPATAAACDLARRYAVDMPIADALRTVLFEGATPADAVRRLLEREAAAER
jgi:glycerol-3-phosphate dehydrogenase (NAD(P)+)